MIDAAAYRANETNAKRAIADWRLSNINDPYIFQNQGFPVRADSFLDLAQILDTMQEGRFDFYMKELGGFTDEDASFFIKVCLDYVDFHRTMFQRERVVVPLSTLISHFVIYKKLLGYDPEFSRLLELGPGCGYLSFFLRQHNSLADYTQIESTESFYLLQSHINSHVFGARFAEHAISRHALDDHGAYHPKLQWHNPFHYEDQKIIKVKPQPVCNHFPWWRIGEVATRRYDVVTSNANLNEFSREALFQYLSLIRDVLEDDGAIVAQCLGGGPPTYETILANMKSAGFVPVALLPGGVNPDGRVFVVANGVFVGKKHPLYAKYADVTPTFPMLDRSIGFVNKMYYMDEDKCARKRILSSARVLQQIEAELARPGSTSRQALPGGRAAHSAHDMAIEKIVSSAHTRDVNRLRRVSAIEQFGTDVGYAAASLSSDHYANVATQVAALNSEIQAAKHEVNAIKSSRSWRITAPLRSLGLWARRVPLLVRVVRWLRS